jgi:hypothetical protein
MSTGFGRENEKFPEILRVEERTYKIFEEGLIKTLHRGIVW